MLSNPESLRTRKKPYTTECGMHTSACSNKNPEMCRTKGIMVKMKCGEGRDKKKKESSVILAYNEQSECQGCWIHQTPTAHSEYSERFSCDKCVIKNDFEPPRIPTHHARWREQSIFVFPSVCVCVLSVQLWQWDEMSALITAPLTSALIVCDRMGC